MSEQPVEICAFLQARVSSTRLPGKVLKPLLGEPMLLRQIERLRRSARIGKLVVVTSTDASDNDLASVCIAHGVPVFRGSLDDVLGRFLAALEVHPCSHVVRLTGDCPLADWRVVDQVIDAHLAGGADYTTNCIEPTFPDGLDVEVVKADVLRGIGRKARLGSEREHVTYYINSHPDEFRRHNVRREPDLSALRWTVDTPADFALVEHIYAGLYLQNPDFDTDAILAWLDAHPGEQALNDGQIRNEGLLKSLAKDHASGTPT